MAKPSLRWSVGAVEIIQIVEMEDNELFSTFIPEAKQEKIREIKWLFPHFAKENGKLRALIQSFLIKSNGKNIVIDTCNGNGKERPNMPTWGNLKTDFLKRFTDSGVAPESIDIVVCTHLHFDHVGWNTKLKKDKWAPTFPNAKYLFSKEEYEYWIKKPEKEMIDDFNGIDDSVTPIVQAGLAEFVADDYRIDENTRLMPTPGHTPHHISVVIESQGKKAIITGDVMHHPCQIARQEWTTLVDTYPDQTIETRKRFLNGVKDTETLVIGSHFASPVAGRVVSSEQGLEFRV
ncbi:MBL fold metallo-hydrolase [Candidatus Roizmanbacteria bacterium]|nr:MBL fold metallo-hydrolase [Candidatus Roizmanbacteria bacterium]